MVKMMPPAGKMRPQVPQHEEKSGREVAREARSRAIMNEIGIGSQCSLGPEPASPPPSQLAAAIQAVKG